MSSTVQMRQAGLPLTPDRGCAEQARDPLSLGRGSLECAQQAVPAVWHQSAAFGDMQASANARQKQAPSRRSLLCAMAAPKNAIRDRLVCRRIKLIPRLAAGQLSIVSASGSFFQHSDIASQPWRRALAACSSQDGGAGRVQPRELPFPLFLSGCTCQVSVETSMEGGAVPRGHPTKRAKQARAAPNQMCQLAGTVPRHLIKRVELHSAKLHLTKRAKKAQCQAG